MTQMILTFDSTGVQSARPLVSRKLTALESAGQRLDSALGEHALGYLGVIHSIETDPARAYYYTRILCRASREVKAASIAHRKAAR